MAYRYSKTPKIDEMFDTGLLANFFINSSKYPALNKAQDLINEAGLKSLIASHTNRFIVLICCHHLPSDLCEPPDWLCMLSKYFEQYVCTKLTKNEKTDLSLPGVIFPHHTQLEAEVELNLVLIYAD